MFPLAIPAVFGGALLIGPSVFQGENVASGAWHGLVETPSESTAAGENHPVQKPA
jgi:hypothetical protein